MERECLTTNEQVMYWVRSGHYHDLGAYCTGYFSVINEYYKRIKKGFYSYIQAEDDSCAEGQEDYCNYKFTYDIDTFLHYMFEDGTGRQPTPEDLDFILSKRPKLNRDDLAQHDCKRIKLLRFAIEDRDKLLESRILEVFEDE